MQIRSIKLLTKQLVELKSFYTDVLGLPLIESFNHTFTVKAGRSNLIFEQIDSIEKTPFYHFAFDIPENKIDESLEWLNSVGVSPNLLSNNSYKEYSSSWNATSIYFYDPAGNIVEFIARHNLNNAIVHSFTGETIINISEIGLVFNDVPNIKDFLNKHHSINEYRDSTDKFAAVGDEEGLFILCAYKRIWYGSKKEADVFKTDITIEGTHEATFTIEDYPYQISVVN